MNKYRFCPACGQQLLPNARFCHNCGHQINDLVEEQNDEVIQENDDVQTVVFDRESVIQENEESLVEPKRKGLFSIFKSKNDDYEEDYDEMEDEYEDDDEQDDYDEYEEEDVTPRKGLGLFEKILIFLIVILLAILIILAVNLAFPDLLKPVKDLLPFNQKEKVVEPLKPEQNKVEDKKMEQPKTSTGALGDYLRNNNLKESDITSLSINNNKVTLNNKEAYDLVNDLKFDDFSTLTNLNELTLSSTSLSNLSGIEKLNNLTKLTLKDNSNLKDVNALISLNNLKEVNIVNTPISDYRPLKNVGSVIFNETHSRVEGTKQIQVIAKDLRRRRSPDSTKTDNIIEGFVDEGYYFIFDEKNVDGTTWYKINNGVWIASKEGDWTKVYN